MNESVIFPSPAAKMQIKCKAGIVHQESNSSLVSSWANSPLLGSGLQHHSSPQTGWKSQIHRIIHVRMDCQRSPVRSLLREGMPSKTEEVAQGLMQSSFKYPRMKITPFSMPLLQGWMSLILKRLFSLTFNETPLCCVCCLLSVCNASPPRVGLSLFYNLP